MRRKNKLSAKIGDWRREGRFDRRGQGLAGIWSILARKGNFMKCKQTDPEEIHNTKDSVTAPHD